PGVGGAGRLLPAVRLVRDPPAPGRDGHRRVRSRAAVADVGHLRRHPAGRVGVLLAAARVPRRKLVAIVDRFFLANLLVFFALLQLWFQREWVARAFFVWTTVFNLFVVSVFWSVVSDVFRP